MAPGRLQVGSPLAGELQTVTKRTHVPILEPCPHRALRQFAKGFLGPPVTLDVPCELGEQRGRGRSEVTCFLPVGLTGDPPL